MPFIVFEGTEGSGKSTQAKRLAKAFGGDTVLTQEPGATSLGRAIRSLLLDHSTHSISPQAEALLFYADRAQHVHEIIAPALSAGRYVISDRFSDSTLAYQGYGRGLSLEMLREMQRAAIGSLRPDLILLLDLPVEEGLRRAHERSQEDRLESETRAFHERVRQGYLELLKEEPSRWMRIDASQSDDAVMTAVLAAVKSRGWL